jgi:hypothetical protein
VSGPAVREPGPAPAPAFSASRLAGRLREPWIWWALAAVFAVRDLVLAIGAESRPDALSLHTAAIRYLFDPGALYTESAQALARTGTLPVPGHAFLYPATAAWLGIPFAGLPEPAAVIAWTVADAAGLVAALLILQRLIRPSGLARPVFWLAAFYFPPLFAEVDAGQVGGVLLLLTVAACWALSRRPALAGALVGFAAAIKYYPAAWLLGVWRLRPWVAAAVTGTLALAAGFARLGPQGAVYYVSSVLLPSLHANYADCAIVSVHTLYLRGLAGEIFYVPGSGGIRPVQAGLQLPWLAAPATYLTDAALVFGVVWATRKAHGHPLYAPLLALSLGALLPGEVNPYQMLPLLPIALLTLVRAIEESRTGLVVSVAFGLALFLRQPCYSPFPNLWTLGGLVLFATAVAAAPLFAKAVETAEGRGKRSVERRR